MAKIQLLVGEECPPCDQLKVLLQKKPRQDVEVVDVTTENGYKVLTALSEQVFIDGIPTAIQGGRKCDIVIDPESETVDFLCRKEVNEDGR